MYTCPMKYENLTRFNDGEFKRLVGVPRPLFLKMISVLQQAELAKKKSRRPHSLHLADKLLLTLNYLSCYRTQIKLSANYNLAESTVNRTIEKVENALIQSRIFALPKKKNKIL